MQAQLWLGTREPDAAHFAPVTNDPHGIILKPRGGLWTSSYDAETRMSEWLAWCYDNMPGWANRRAWVLTPAPDARVYTINGVADLKHLCARYATEELMRLRQLNRFPAIAEMYPPLDFASVATDYDAIHLTSGGEARTRLSTPSLYGWDCESTVWLRWAFMDVQAATVATAEEYEALYAEA